MKSAEEKLKEISKYKIDYAKEHYKRIPLDVTPDKYDEIKKTSARMGESVNGYIKKAINDRLKRNE